MKTKIGKYHVKVRNRKGARILLFRDGPYAFWTAVFRVPVEGRKRIYGRAAVGLSAGDRFDRMKRECSASYIPKEDRPIYRKWWLMMGRGENISFVRPSTEREIDRWLETHPAQAGTLIKRLC